MNFFSMVFGFRNRDVERVKRCLDSIDKQTFKNFEVVFIDYGSDDEIARKINQLTSQYPFVNYQYNFVKGMPWNRSHALNSGVRISKGNYIIFGDVDLIYPQDFLEVVNSTVFPQVNLYDCFFLLPENFCDWDNLGKEDMKGFNTAGKASKGGVHILERSALEKIGGYDEFYCYWGVEDRDLFFRLTEIGLKETWLDHNSKVFHQWHPVTSDFYQSAFPLQLWEDMNIHYETLKSQVVRNPNGWGKMFKKNDRPVFNDELKNSIAKLEFRDSPLGKNGKSDIIAQIFQHLRKCTLTETVSFVIENSAPLTADDFFSKTFKAGRMSFLSKKYFELLKQDYFQYRFRMNHFIPEEDLNYIFRKIILADPRWDYSFIKAGGQMIWKFALKASF